MEGWVSWAWIGFRYYQSDCQLACVYLQRRHLLTVTVAEREGFEDMIVEVRRLLEDEKRESRKSLPQTPVTGSHVKVP